MTPPYLTPQKNTYFFLNVRKTKEGQGVKPFMDMSLKSRGFFYALPYMSCCC